MLDPARYYLHVFWELNSVVFTQAGRYARDTRARLEYYTIRGRSMLGRVELKRAEKTVSRSSLLCNGKTESRGKIFKKKPIEVLNNKQEVKERA